LSLVATCPVGVEEFVAGELTALGAVRVEAGRGAVTCVGGWALVFAANLQLRCANRVLVELSRSAAANDRELAQGASWLVEGSHVWAGLSAADLFSPERTLSVHASASRSALHDVRWIAQRTKDGIVDAQRRRYEERSSVDRENADVPLRVLLRDDMATFLLDTSREPLDRRGYRVQSVDAPLREHLAAACVLAAGPTTGPIYDPMCGSGTLLIEAAMVRLGLPANRLRERWMFESLPVFDRLGWERLRQETHADAEVVAGSVELCGVDRDDTALRAAERNLEAAGLAGCAFLHAGDAFDTDAPAGPGLLLVNPPYGERLGLGGQEPTAAWRALGDLLKQRFAGWTAVVLAGGEGLGKQIGLRPRRRFPVRNGALEARILVFDLY
jgi:putative N6-adenine-specific DNA methylase